MDPTPLKSTCCLRPNKVGDGAGNDWGEELEDANWDAVDADGGGVVQAHDHSMDLLLSGSAELEGGIAQGHRAIAAAVPRVVAGVNPAADLGDLGQVVVVDVLCQRSVSSHYFPTFM